MLTLAFVKYSSKGRELGSYHGTVYPDTFDVAATHVHGITQEYARENGQPFGYLYASLKEATKALAEETGKLEEKFRIQNETRQKVNATLKQQRDSYIATNKTIVESLTNVIKLQQKIDDYNANQTLFQAWVTSSKLFKSESEKAFIETEQNIQKLESGAGCGETAIYGTQLLGPSKRFPKTPLSAE